MTIHKRLLATIFPVLLASGAALAADEKKGKEIFENTACMGCHNTDTDEKRGNAPSLKGIMKKEGVTEEKVTGQIRKGGNGMPPYEEDQITKEDMEHLLAYLKTI